MLVSGGKILAIDHAVTDDTTMTGDGACVPIGVNTKKIATKDYVNTVSSDLTTEINKKIDKTEAYNAFLASDALNAYSANWTSAYEAVTASADIWNAKQDALTCRWWYKFW